MFDLGIMEILVIGIVALIVVGPKDLPGLFRTVGKAVGKMKGMAREFQRSMDDAAKNAGVDDALDGVKSAAGGLKKATSFNPLDFNKDLKSMTKDAIKKNTMLDDDAKAAALKKVDTSAEKKPAAKKPATKPVVKKPAAKTAKKTTTKTATKTAPKKPAVKPVAKTTAKKPAAKTAAKTTTKTAAKKPAAKKPAAKKAPAKKDA